MNQKQFLKEIAKKQQDLVRDCQHCLNSTDDDNWKDFFGQLARDNADLAHKCLDKLNGH